MRQFGHVASLLALLVLLVGLIAPRSTPILLPLLGAPIIALAASGGLGPLPHPPLLAALAALGAYLFFNALWAVDPVEGLSRALFFSAIVAFVTVVAMSLARLDQEDARRLEHALLIGIGLGALLLAIDTPLGQPIRRAVVSLLPFLRPAPKHMAVSNGWVETINLYTLNRNLAVLNLVLWPAFLLLRSCLTLALARTLAAVLLGLAALAIFTSEHETSMIAIVAGCLVFAGVSVAAPVMRALVLAGWIGATMLIVPLAAVSHEAGLHQAQWLPGTARNRVVLWNVTARKIAEAPLLGIGIGSTKPLDEEAAPTAEKQPGDAYPQRTGRHSHNIFMQTWYELGAVGAILLLVAGVMGLRVLARLPRADQPYAYASFVAAAVIASFTWGMWQPWFMAAFGIWAIVLAIALDAARRSRPNQGA
jgi:O-antigen ligase